MLKSLQIANLVGKASIQNKNLLKYYGKFFSFSELEVLRSKVDKNSQVYKVNKFFNQLKG